MDRFLLVFSTLLSLAVLTSEAGAQELRDQYHPAPRDTVSQEVYDGWKQFNLNCARCHGEDMQGTTIEKIYAYVKSRSDAKTAPGRPALKPGA